MVNGISGMTGSNMAHMVQQQRSGAASVTRGDNDGDRDDGGPAKAGPDVDTAVQTTSSGGTKGSLFNGIA